VLRPGGLPQCSRGDGPAAKPSERASDVIEGRRVALQETPPWLDMPLSADGRVPGVLGMLDEPEAVGCHAGQAVRP